MEVREINGFKINIFTLGNFLIGIPEEIGPRILYLSLKGYENLNLFGIVPDFGIQTSEGLWKIYGGHRLWVSPEAKPLSYSMDNLPVKIKLQKNKITITGNIEEKNCIQKKIKIYLSGKKLKVVHSIKNTGRWPITFSCWALSVMRKNGFAIVPISPSRIDKEKLLPDRKIVLWPYTDLSDERILFSENYFFLKQTEKESPVKLGTYVNSNWVGYWVDGFLFLKEFSTEENYPDYGCNVEVFTNSQFLELETIGELKTIPPGRENSHIEYWSILPVENLKPDENEIREKVIPFLSKKG